MLQRVIKSEKLFSLPETQYKYGDSKITAAPSIAIVDTERGATSSDKERIGYYLAPMGKFWEFHLPVNVSQAILGLELLAECPVIEDDTLCACFYVMKEEVDATAEHYLESLEKSGFFDVEDHRKELLEKGVDEKIEQFLSNKIPHTASG